MGGVEDERTAPSDGKGERIVMILEWKEEDVILYCTSIVLYIGRCMIFD